MNKFINFCVTLLLYTCLNFNAPVAAQMVETGKEISFRYSVKLIDGTLIAENYSSEPLDYIYGSRQLVPGLEKALAGMKVGQSKDLVVQPAEAYGIPDPAKIVEVKRNSVNGAVQLGQYVEGVKYAGQLIRAKVLEVRPDTLLLDFNHPLAGQALQYSLKVVAISDSAAS